MGIKSLHLHGVRSCPAEGTLESTTPPSHLQPHSLPSLQLWPPFSLPSLSSPSRRETSPHFLQVLFLHQAASHSYDCTEVVRRLTLSFSSLPLSPFPSLYHSNYLTFFFHHTRLSGVVPTAVAAIKSLSAFPFRKPSIPFTRRATRSIPVFNVHQTNAAGEPRHCRIE